jgi:hypothetical protein
MKKLLWVGTCLVAFLISHSLHINAQRLSNKDKTITIETSGNSGKLINDTLMPGNWNNITPNYVMIAAEDGGYILGTNNWNDKCKCQQYKVTYYYKLEGAIYWFGFKRALSGGVLKFTVWNMNGATGTTSDTNNQPCPGTPYQSMADSITHIDTSNNLQNAHVVMFTYPINITSDYCIGFDMGDIADDSIALVSTSNGQGGSKELVWEQWNSDNKWYTLQGAQWDEGNMDIDAMIMPIIDNTSGCVENDAFIMGMKTNPAFPNPCQDFCTIKYQFEKPVANASIEIIDMKGKKYFYSESLPKSDQINEFKINVTEFPSGEYIYILQCDSGKIAKRFTIVK